MKKQSDGPEDLTWTYYLRYHYCSPIDHLAQLRFASNRETATAHKNETDDLSVRWHFPRQVAVESGSGRRT